MADKGEKVKVEIGFGIGQVLSVKLTAAELKELRAAVEAGSGWHDMKTQEGSVALNLASVLFLRVDDGGQAIGFSG
ncbi:MAG: hypothetical protein M3383_09280 [Actinomycetota bacterium]|nr:hypothetical protein [Actinomycetota bacterium]